MKYPYFNMKYVYFNHQRSIINYLSSFINYQSSTINNQGRHLGVILGSFGDHFGVIWGHSGSNKWPNENRFGSWLKKCFSITSQNWFGGPGGRFFIRLQPLLTGGIFVALFLSDRDIIIGGVCERQKLFCFIFVRGTRQRFGSFRRLDCGVTGDTERRTE